MAVPPDPTPSEVSQLGVPGAGESGGVRQAVSRATTRIEEIIDSAERVASEIRADAEAEANQLLESRRREAEELEREADRIRAETERLLREREEVIAGVAQGLGTELGELRSSLEHVLVSIDRTEQAISGMPPDQDPEPSASPFGGDLSVTPVSSDPSASLLSGAPPAPEATPGETEAEAEPVGADIGTSDFSASPGGGAAPDEPADDVADDVDTGGDADADAPEAGEADDPQSVSSDMLSPVPAGASSDEAMLRATQMAVAGSSRDEIGRTLEAEFGIDDPEPILEQILGPALAVSARGPASGGRPPRTG